MKLNKTGRILVTCARGLGECLSKEISSLGYEVLEQRDNGVEIESDWYGVMDLNLKLRSALGVLWRVKKFRANSTDDFYKSLSEIPWEDIIPADEYMSIVSRADTPCINNTMYVNQLTKDAIVDRLAGKTGARPDSGPLRDNIVVNVFWHKKDCWVYINTSGNKLADRNYRKIPFKAPLQESLAASLLMAAGYDGSQPLVLPMCGSGTLAIEAAMIALNRPAGIHRSNFCFMHLKNFDKDAWQEMRSAVQKQVRKQLDNSIIASDIDPSAIEASIKNAKTAGVDHLIDFQVCDFAETQVPAGQGVMIMNPEYGERLGEKKRLEATYSRIGDFLKQRCKGYSAYVFTGNLDLAKKIGLQTSRRFVFYNAQIECRLLKYEIYAGSRKAKYTNDNPQRISEI